FRIVSRCPGRIVLPLPRLFHSRSCWTVTPCLRAMLQRLSPLRTWYTTVPPWADDPAELEDFVVDDPAVEEAAVEADRVPADAVRAREGGSGMVSRWPTGSLPGSLLLLASCIARTELP